MSDPIISINENGEYTNCRFFEQGMKGLISNRCFILDDWYNGKHDKHRHCIGCTFFKVKKKGEGNAND